MIFSGITMHQENTRLELPRVVNGSCHLSQAVLFVKRTCFDIVDVVSAITLNKFVSLDDKCIGKPGLIPYIHRFGVDFYHSVTWVPHFCIGAVLMVDFNRLLLFCFVVGIPPVEIDQTENMFLIVALLFDAEESGVAEVVDLRVAAEVHHERKVKFMHNVCAQVDYVNFVCFGDGDGDVLVVGHAHALDVVFEIVVEY